MRSSLVVLLFVLGCRDTPCVRHSDCDPEETCSPAGLCIALHPDAAPDADPDAAADADPDSATDAATDAAPDAPLDAPDPPLHHPSPDTMSPS